MDAAAWRDACRSSEGRYVRDTMSEDKKTLLMAVLSWVLPLSALASSPIFHSVFRPYAAGSDAAMWRYLIALGTFLPVCFTGAVALAVVARKRSARSHASGSHKHATVGLILSLSLLTCFVAVVVLQVITVLSRT